ncbi:BV/ODV-E26 [Parapoynx stagnalis nucleopolyhedrovirus]|uniref:BV/ODV-E26 n=1 Tax=Parapoynx stagnalis nucleopolyhedrovirus TaxID=2993413 RepID=A0A9E8BW63_9ABAC|nr:BV/ODV-E26 [Parapoynx stagnalis nucleopolyhedrovirus]
MNAPPPKLFDFCPPQLSVTEFAASRKPPNAVSFGCVSSLTCTTTTITSTKLQAASPVTKNLENVRKISCIISSLRNTHLNFNKIQNLQKKRLKHLRNLIRKKNRIISQLVDELELVNKLKNTNLTRSNNNISDGKSNKYLGIVRCSNIIRTVYGREKFVRRRLAELCTLHKAEYIYCAICTGHERQHIAQLLLDTYLTRVIVFEKNRRFEFLKDDEALEAKRLILDFFNNESHNKTNSN